MLVVLISNSVCAVLRSSVEILFVIELDGDVGRTDGQTGCNA